MRCSPLLWLATASFLLLPVSSLEAKDVKVRERIEQYLPAPIARNATGVIRHVIDGDTVRLADNRVIRLACVDAPDLETIPDKRETKTEPDSRERNFRADSQSWEPHFQHYGAQYFSHESKAALQNFAQGKRVKILAPTLRKDGQKRLIADLQLQDGSTLSHFLLEYGLAYYAYDKNFSKAYQDKLIKTQAKAIRAGRGFWGMLLAMNTAKRTYIGNSETFLFYSTRDIRSQKIRPRKRVYFGHLLDAFRIGFAPANSMDFWPPEKKKK